MFSQTVMPYEEVKPNHPDLESETREESSKKKEDGVSFLMAEGRDQFKKKNFETAITIYKDAIELCATSDDNFFRRGECQTEIANCYSEMAKLPNITEADQEESLRNAKNYYLLAHKCFKSKEPSSDPTVEDKEHYLQNDTLYQCSNPSRLHRLYYLEVVNLKLKNLYQCRKKSIESKESKESKESIDELNRLIHKIFLHEDEAVKVYERICRLFSIDSPIQNNLFSRFESLMYFNMKISHDYEDKNKLDKAITHANNACKLAKQLAEKNPDDVYKKQYAERLIRAAELYDANEEASNALENYNIARQIYNDLKIPLEVSQLNRIERLSDIVEMQSQNQASLPGPNNGTLKFHFESPVYSTATAPTIPLILGLVKTQNMEMKEKTNQNTSGETHTSPASPPLSSLSLDQSPQRRSSFESSSSPHVSNSTFSSQHRRSKTSTPPQMLPTIPEDIALLHLDSPVAEGGASKSRNRPK